MFGKIYKSFDNVCRKVYKYFNNVCGKIYKSLDIERDTEKQVGSGCYNSK